ncbi:metallophosphoesterase [Paracoccaceae bacterium Fryx2]|nr:metallophosphoesterase [Paracoccaceae bacterium Fryx2]
MAHFYTADLHLNHSAIIRFCNRPFADAKVMDQTILQNFESQVGWDDDLWIVGDFGFGGGMHRAYLERCFQRLPGRKHLIVGNHDKPWVRTLGWASVHDIVSVTDGDRRFLLCHYPMITRDHARRGAVQVFGHVHNNWLGSRNAVNVGVDVWNFRPVQAADILRRARTLPVNRHWSDVEPGSATGTAEEDASGTDPGPRPRR